MADLRPRLTWRPDITPPPCRMSRGLERNLSRHFFFFWLVLFFSFCAHHQLSLWTPAADQMILFRTPVFFFFSVPPPYANTEGVLKARYQGGRVLASTRRCPPPWHVRPQSPLTHAVYELKRPLYPRACVTHASFFSIKRRPGNVLRDDGITRTRSVHFVWSHGARTDIEACATVVFFFLDVRRRYGESR